MCGIFAILGLGVELAALRALVKRDCTKADSSPQLLPIHQMHEIEAIIPAVMRRGPDYRNWHLVDIAQGEGMIAILSTVLHLRGENRCDQPVVDDFGNILAWNGEIFGGEIKVDEGCSDTLAMSDRLSKACCFVLIMSDNAHLSIRLLQACRYCGEGVLSAINSVEGPFAFVFWDASVNRLWFGRDRLGRRRS